MSGGIFSDENFAGGARSKVIAREVRRARDHRPSYVPEVDRPLHNPVEHGEVTIGSDARTGESESESGYWEFDPRTEQDVWVVD